MAWRARFSSYNNLVQSKGRLWQTNNNWTTFEAQQEVDCPTGNTEQATVYDNKQSGYYTPDDWNV